MEEEVLSKYIHKSIKNSISSLNKWRKQAKICFDFYAGHQWEDTDKETLQVSGRVPIVFNRIARAVNAVSGMQRQNRMIPSFHPREINDSAISEYVGDVITWARDMTEAEDEESDMFEDALICGVGWTETFMDYDTGEPRIREERVDPLEMGWDPSSTKRNFSDARYVFRYRNISRKEFELQWPGKEPQGWGFDFLSDSDDPHDSTEAKYYKNDQGGSLEDSDKVLVVHFQWWEREPVYYVRLNGEEVSLSQKEYNSAKKNISSIGGEAERVLIKRYKQAFINGSQILEKSEAPTQYAFSFQATTGFRDRKNKSWFGLVSMMLDPQMYANKWLSQVVYILATNAKGGLYAERGAFENPQKAEEDFASPDRILFLNDNMLQKGAIKERAPADFPPGLDKLLGYAMEAISDVPGVNQELLGVANREQAGYLEAQRKQAGLTILATFFDSFRRYTKCQGKLFLDYVRDYLPERTLVRVASPEQGQLIPLIKDRMTGIFDISVDDAPTSPNMKDKVFSAVSKLMEVLIPAGIPVPVDILDYAPIPQKLVASWKQQMQPPPPDPEAEAAKKQMEALQMESMQAMNNVAKADAAEKQTKSALNLAKAEESETKAALNEAQAFETTVEAGKEPDSKSWRTK